jgi:hypothetical protein
MVYWVVGRRVRQHDAAARSATAQVERIGPFDSLGAARLARDAAAARHRPPGEEVTFEVVCDFA